MKDLAQKQLRLSSIIVVYMFNIIIYQKLCDSMCRVLHVYYCYKHVSVHHFSPTEIQTGNTASAFQVFKKFTPMNLCLRNYLYENLKFCRDPQHTRMSVLSYLCIKYYVTRVTLHVAFLATTSNRKISFNQLIPKNIFAFT